MPSVVGAWRVTETSYLLQRLRAGSAVFAIVGLGALAASFASAVGPSRAYLVAAAAALIVVFAVLHITGAIVQIVARRRLKMVMTFLEHDVALGFCTDDQGSIFAQNRAAMDRFGPQDGTTMSRALEPIFANPDAVVHRLRTQTRGSVCAREDVVTRRGHVRVSVHRIPGGYLWRLEDMVDRPTRGGDGLGLPILTVGSSGTILYMNEVLRGIVGRRAKRLRDVFDDLPLRNGELNVLRTESGSQQVRVMLSDPIDGRQEVFVLPASGAEDGHVALDALPVALLRLNAEGTVVFANRPARDLLPLASDGGERRLAAMVEGLGRSVGEWVAESASGRGLNRPEVVRVTGSEPETFLQVTLGRPVDGDGGDLIAVLNDATELKTMELQFVQSQKMQAIGQLAGGVAHDFNNLLTAISGHCDLLLLRHGEADADHADLMQITQNANRAAALVGQLLAFSRKQTLQMERVDLRDAIGDLAHLLNRLVGERVQLRTVHDAALLPIRGDRRQLEQVLMNLVVNARDAMPDGGEIILETRCRYLDRPMRRDRVTVPAGQFVVVTVTDEGSGIPSDKLGRIFEPFYTTKRPGEGTGLGLSMVYGIVKQSGGYIFADSTFGRGTCFSLYFPAHQPEPQFDDALGPDDAAVIDAEPAAIAADPTPPDAVQVREDAPTPEEAEAAEVSAQAPPSPPVQPSDYDSGTGDADRPADESPATEQAHRSGDIVSQLIATSGGTAPVPDSTEDDLEATEETASGGGVDPVGPEPVEEDSIQAAITATVTASHGEDRDMGDELSVSASDEEPGAVAAKILLPSDEVSDLDASAPEARPAHATGGAEGLQPQPVSDDPPSEDMQTVQARLKASAGNGLTTEAGGQKRVLLVEDEAPVRAFAIRALRLRGYDVVEAACAEDALKLLDDGDLSVDLFLTDVMMPGLDGPSWVKIAMEDRPGVPTVFMSGYAQEALTETSVPVPNAMFLTKPFSLADLTRTIEQALR